MTVVPSGSFKMGPHLTAEEEASQYGLKPEVYKNEYPVHQVTIDQPFAVGVYEVTWNQWKACVADGGCSDEPNDNGWGRGDRPVINVTWQEAREYVQWLSDKTGADYRLLTEAEWEYVARAGTRTRFWWGDDFIEGRANCDNEECGDRWDNTAPVGSFSPNPWGLYDVHGNVSEWVQDCQHDSYKDAPADGSAWRRNSGGDCTTRMLRGGNWMQVPRSGRAADRDALGWDSRLFGFGFIGFRVARDFPE